MVKANLKVLTGGDGDCFNIGTGQETKTLELYQIIYEAVREIRPEISDELLRPLRGLARPGDIPRSCLLVEKAHSTPTATTR